MEVAELLANLRPAILVLDPWGDIVQVHGGADDGFLGYAMDDLVGRSGLDYVATGDREVALAVFADGSSDVTQRFHLPFPIRMIARDGHVEVVQALTTRLGDGDDVRWIIMLTPQGQQPLTQDVMERYLAGADAPRVAATLAERITGVRAEGVAIEAFVVHEPRSGRLGSVIAGRPGRPLAHAMAAYTPDPAAPWNGVSPDRYRTVDMATLPPPVAEAASGYCECDVRVLAGEGGPSVAVVLFGNEPKTLTGSVRMVADRAFDVVAMAQARSESLEVLRLAAELDPLTGLANRSRFAALLDEEDEATTGFLYIDIDRFKTINDTLGHAVGDAILVAVAGRITAACRAVDMVARIGGDEFVVMLRDVDEALAIRIGSRVREAAADPLPGGLGVEQVTVSVGVAVGARDRRALVRAADLAMLEGKRRGRDVVMTPAGPVGVA